MKDIEILLFALGIETQRNDKEFLEECSNLKIFDFIKNCVIASLRLLNHPDCIKILELTKEIHAKLLHLNPGVVRYMFECELCERSFYSAKKLRRHMFVHTKPKEFGCEVCGKYFRQKESLRAHMRLHLNINYHHCDVCDITFSKIKDFNAHIKTKKHIMKVNANKFE